MFNFDYIPKGDIKEHNAYWPEIPNHPNRILIVGISGSGKTNALLLISRQSDFDKIYIYAQIYFYLLIYLYPQEAKYQLLINKRESAGIKCFNDSKIFTDYPNDMDDIYKNIEVYNSNKKENIDCI